MVCSEVNDIATNYSKNIWKIILRQTLLQEMWTRQKEILDRDENAAKNILLVGRSVERPACFKRGFPAPNYLSVDLSSSVAGVVESL